MFMGYSWDRWLGVGEYMIIVLVLFIMIAIASVKFEKLTSQRRTNK